MTEKEPASENPNLIMRESPETVEEASGEKQPVQGMLSVVYADGLGNPPALVLTGAPGYPESLLLVDETGAPVAMYTAGPPPQSSPTSRNLGLAVPGAAAASSAATAVGPLGAVTATATATAS
ncbi:hypothetical protein [Streptomyces phaeochromogenes]|uniref:hypothetical protein n=1 Tax=Streptomyces phaeochromogenes TaxID=1923 RepID=UPI002E166BB7|nr:hypothetical protein OG437_50805 [Streptomyces phaeochromogenes]